MMDKGILTFLNEVPGYDLSFSALDLSDVYLNGAALVSSLRPRVVCAQGKPH